jgi:hypothetical protein
MWYSFDPDLNRDLANIRRLVGLRHQTPTREWPLMFSADRNLLFVVREWPDGTITAYTTDQSS